MGRTGRRLAERDGRVVGFYALAGQPPNGVLEDLFVEPDQIGTGIGRALWQHAVQVASRLGSQRLTPDADPGYESSTIQPGGPTGTSAR